MLKVDDDPDLLETIKKSNPKLKEIAMSVAERLEQKGIQKGKIEGRLEGRLEGKLEGEKEKAVSIAKSMLLRGYPTEDIILITGLSPTQVHDLI